MFVNSVRRQAANYMGLNFATLNCQVALSDC